MTQDIRVFRRFQEAANAHLSEVQLAIAQSTGDYLDMSEAVLCIKNEDDLAKLITIGDVNDYRCKGYQKAIAMFEPKETGGRLRSLIFENGYGRHFVKKDDAKGFDLVLLRKIEYKECE